MNRNNRTGKNKPQYYKGFIGHMYGQYHLKWRKISKEFSDAGESYVFLLISLVN